MKRTIDSSYYKNEIHTAFKRSPLSYSKSQEIHHQLTEYYDKAETLFQSGDYYQAACIYKALLEQSVEHLEHLEDKHGLIGKMVFNVFTQYASALQALDLDKELLYKDIFRFYLTEDQGFAFEIITLILKIITPDDYHILERNVLSSLKKCTSNYKKDKILTLLIHLYSLVGEHGKYFETCTKFPKDSLERYVYAADKYEALGNQERAVEAYEEGLRNAIHHKESLEIRYHALKQRILGLA